MAAGARQQQAFGASQVGGRRGGAQREDAGHDLSNVGVGRQPKFGVQFAEGDLQRPLVGTDLPQTVQRQIDALANTDSGGASEQQR
jgi:hypothetical protein